MPSLRQYTLMFLLATTLGLGEAGIALPADERANAARTISRRFDLTSDSASQAADAVIVQASEVLERTAQSGDASEADLVIELRSDFRLSLEKDSMNAGADRAVVLVKYHNASKTVIESLTVKLAGNARWTCGGIAASGERLTLSFRTPLVDSAGSPPSTAWVLRGRARLRGRNFVAGAKQVSVQLDSEAGSQAEGAMLIKLDGDATLRSAAERASGQVRAARMEIRPRHGALPPGLLGIR